MISDDQANTVPAPLHVAASKRHGNTAYDTR